MFEKKLKHLEFIQATITRMSTNSFIIKGWAITIVSALYALAAKDSNPKFAIITYLAIILFWYLNSFFLLQERRYRALYDVVRAEDEGAIDFRMDASSFNSGKNTLMSSIVSKSIWPLYFFMLLITFLIIYYLNGPAANSGFAQ